MSIEKLQAEISTLEGRLAAARAELLNARFEGVPRYKRGTVVLVPRMLFGKRKWWPARIMAVHLHYGSGTDANGTPWETKVVSYSVEYQLADGSGFSDTTTSAWHKEVQLLPETGEG